MTTVVVIPNWNGLPFVLDCLESLALQSEPHDVVLVDNGSTDKSVSAITTKYPSVKIIKLPINTGFAGGVNEGIVYSLKNKYKYIALLNNDACPSNNWLKYLVNTLDCQHNVGIATCKLLNYNGTYFDSTGDFYTIHGIPFPRDRNTKDVGQRNEIEEVFSASGGASLYRSEVFKEIGLFDEYFFAYYEDTDLSFRARLVGWKVIYNPKSVCYHKTSSTSSGLAGFSRFHSAKNMPILYLKNMPGVLFFKYLPLFYYQLVRQLFSSVVKKQGLLHIRALVAVHLHIPRALVDRNRIQKNRSISISEIDEILVHSKPPKIPRF